MQRFLPLLLLVCGAFSSRASAEKIETAVLGAGCFWCVEAIYEQLPGVIHVVSGYAGGTEKNPSYKDVSYGRTHHAEVVQITFDAEKTSYRKLVDFFWHTHDVTDGSGVWPDFGPQYRSILLPANDEQMRAAFASRAAAQTDFKQPIATTIQPLQQFYPAEDYHQDYVRLNPNDRYVRNIAYPKLKKLGLKRP